MCNQRVLLFIKNNKNHIQIEYEIKSDYTIKLYARINTLFFWVKISTF